MKYGYFDDATKEYVLTNFKTPIKWCNYVGTLKFGGLIDTTGGVLLCKGDPALNRITKYVAQMPSSDFKGGTVYIKVKNSKGKEDVFSPFYTPTLKKLDKFECRVGLLYSTFIAEAYGVRSEITYFVPQGKSVMLQDIKIKNISEEELEISVIPVYEFSHFDALKQFTNADWVPQTMTLNAHRDETGCVILEQYAFMKKNYAINYVTANRAVSSFDGDRRVFLGDNEYGSWSMPLSLLKNELSNSTCIRGDNIAALKINFGKIAKGITERTVVQFGQEESLKVAKEKISEYKNLDNVDKEFENLKIFWTNYLAVMEVETPNASMNSMLNIHNPKQCYMTKNWSRDLSLYQLGFGGRGIGFRDSSQDLLGVMAHIPSEAKKFIVDLLSVQKPDGSAMHQYYASTMEANEGDSREHSDRPKYYGDDNLWIVLTVSQYLRETGNFDFLDEQVTFYDKSKPIAVRETGSVWEHLVRSVEFTQNNKGAHGLPLLGFADWNDTINLPTGAESFQVAALFGRALQEMIEISKTLGKQDYSEKFKKYYDEMKKAVNDCGWDGEWFIRYYDHKGGKLGSKENKYGKIYTNGQSWPIMAGFADVEKAKISLESVNKHLNTKYGIKLSTPGYNGYDPELGGVSTYPPGAKENGGIFLHANPWVMIAETMVGNGDRAFQYYDQINPAAKNEIIDIFESEPYCYPQNILGDEHKQFGLGRNAWLSGTSSWTYVAGTQYILGVKPGMNGLEINPCIPKSWKGFKVKRVYRGAVYKITVNNQAGVSKGVKSIIVNGKVVAGNVIPIFKQGETVEVVVDLG